MKRTIVYFHGELFGFLLENEDYRELGGRLLASAFHDHHVQLVSTPKGKIGIVDDISSDAFWSVEGANVDMLPCQEPGRGEALGAKSRKTNGDCSQQACRRRLLLDLSSASLAPLRAAPG